MDFKSKWFRYGPYALVFLISIPTLFQIASLIETRYFPVINILKIERLETNTYSNPVISGTLERARGGCVFRNMVFFLQNGEYESPIGIQTPGNVIGRDRPAGNYTFGPWTLFTTPEVLKNQSYARVIHQCHPFYDTITYLNMKDMFDGQD